MAPASQDPEPIPSDEAALYPYLPMVYVAWADGDLEADEIRAICARLREAEGVDGRCAERLGRWLDPERPPSAAELQGLLRTVRRAAAPLSRGERRSLSQLGAELSQRAGRPLADSERAALDEVEAALGLGTADTGRLLLAPERPEPEPEPPPAPFSPAALSAYLDESRATLRRQIRARLAAPEAVAPPGLDRDAYRGWVTERVRALAADGLGALSFPAEAGGAGDAEGFVAVFEELAYGDLSVLVKFGVQFGLFGGSILQLGTASHHRRYLPAAGTLELPGCFAMTETGHGSNVQELETSARFDPATAEFVVHTPDEAAGKDYIGNAARDGRLATVFARLVVGDDDYGVHALLVPIRDADGAPREGVRIEDCGEKLGLNGVDNGRLWFDRVRVPRENLLDRFASVSADGVYSSPITSSSKRFFTMLGTLVGGRVSVALASLSAAKTALAVAIRYGARRRQFGPPGAPERVLLDYRTHQRRLMPRLASTFALHFALRELTRRYLSMEESDRRRVEGLAAGLKAASSWHCTDTVQGCREACGGQGYLAENRFAALKADTDVFTTFEGDNTVLLQLVAKGLLTGYRKQFGDLSPLGVVRFLAGRAATAIAELNPVVTRLTDEAHLRDRDFHRAALAWREDHLLSTLARRLKARIDRGLDGFDALNEVQDHALALAKAHVERWALERFAEAVDACPDRQVAAALSSVCDLYALERIERDRGWFQEHGYLEAAKAKAIRKQVNRLCRELREIALPLVDGLGLDDAVLRAPIARGG